MKNAWEYRGNLKKWKVGKMKHPECSRRSCLVQDFVACGNAILHLSNLTHRWSLEIASLRVPEAAQATRALTVKTGNNEWHCKQTWPDREQNERPTPESMPVLSLRYGKHAYKRTCLDSALYVLCSSITESMLNIIDKAFRWNWYHSSTAVMTLTMR